MNKYESLSKGFLCSSVFLGVIALICFILFWWLLKKWKNKYVEEVQPQLIRLLAFIGVTFRLSSILGLIGILLK